MGSGGWVGRKKVRVRPRAYDRRCRRRCRCRYRCAYVGARVPAGVVVVRAQVLIVPLEPLVIAAAASRVVDERVRVRIMAMVKG